MKRSAIARATLRLFGTAGILGLVIAGGLSAYAVAAPSGPKKRHYTATLTGAAISAPGTRFEDVYKVVSSLDGTGAAIQEGKVPTLTLPVNGSATFTSYFANGVSKRKDKFTLSALNASGISTITGSGKCKGGTGVHKKETCKYTFKGTWNTSTGIFVIHVRGTDTR